MRNKTIWPLLFILILWAGSAWGADYTACASGCDGNIAAFEGGTAPFDDLNGDTVTFTENQTASIDLRAASFGTSMATLVFTGKTITVSGGLCLQTNGADKVTIEGGTWSGGSGTTAAFEVEANSDNITLNNITANPNSGNNRIVRIYGNSDNFTLSNSTIVGQTSTQNLVHFYIATGETCNNVTFYNNAFSGGYANIINCAPTGTVTLTGWNLLSNSFTSWGDAGNDTAFNFTWTDASVVGSFVVSSNTFTSGNRAILFQNTEDDDTAAAYGIDFDGNFCFNNGSMSLDIRQLTSTGGKSYIRNNYVTNPGQGTTAQINGLRCGACNGVYIEGNSVNYLRSVTTDGNCYIIDKGTVNSAEAPSTACIVRNNYGYDCRNTSAGGGGISVYASTGTKVYNNKMANCYNNFRTGGIAGLETDDTEFYFNTSSGGIGVGLQVRRYGGTVTARNNIFYSAPYGVRAETLSEAPTLSNNAYFGNTTYDTWDDDTSAAITDTGSVTSAPPLFESATDFHLQATSPCLGTGTPIAGIYTDFDGWMRRYPESIGAYADHSRYKGYNNINFRISGNPARGANVDNSLIEIDE